MIALFLLLVIVAIVLGLAPLTLATARRGGPVSAGGRGQPM
jgi:hypothetical protein